MDVNIFLEKQIGYDTLDEGNRTWLKNSAYLYVLKC